MAHLLRAILLLLCIVFVSGCERKGQPASAKPLIVASIPPQQWFVERIGAARVQTLVLAGPAQNPHNYEPTPRQVSALSGAKAWILSGAEFEISLRPKIERLFPALPIIDGTAGVAFRSMEDHDHDDDDHDHGPSPLEIDRHTWLGREPAKILGVHIRDALCAIDPAGAEAYQGNYAALEQEIESVFAALRVELAPLEGSNVFVYHPSFGYFLDEFGIRQQAVEIGGKSPGPRELARLIALAKEEMPVAIFVQAQFPVNAAQTVADAVGAQVIFLDPLAENWLENIRRMGKALYDTSIQKKVQTIN